MAVWLGLLGRWRQRRRAALARRAAIRETVAALGAGHDVDALRAALLAYPAEPEILAAAAAVARRDGRALEAELLSRAADAPDDPTVCLDLGLHFSERGVLDLAIVVLERAVMLNPLDALGRSELALCLGRQGAHGRVVEVLALHPCLATDPGALFQFGWSAQASGDAATARAACRQLEELDAPELAARLRAALG